ncbi:peptidoglycan-binding protein [Deinococcus sp. AJ005]|uniref:peptidoglycan-binding domain-containing protein n=1 Tax=Deinococcus sp. AJ005 TaxID=2652443 RepID=UPI00125CA65F|nr:peptidoglycan-binding domain-containing protein [Deinococcus sp. AJ005]QFP78041.1 peptidoglycan-binding protein [Deinococcus sp. AJ005]
MKRVHTLAFALLTAIAGAAPGGADLKAAALQTAQTLGGVLRDCPSSFAGIGLPEKQCVGVSDGVEDARLKLNAALADDLYSVWRSRDEQRSVYNWLKTAGGYVYLRLQPDPDGRTQTLVYLDLPPAQDESAQAQVTQAQAGPSGDAPAGATRIGVVILTPAPPVTTVPAPSPTAEASPPAQTQAVTPAPTAPAPAPATPDLAPVPFGRTLKLQNDRLHGPDVLAVQNRLIALMRPQRAGQGDGWYGPATTQTVRVFQRAAGLPITGAVDRATWNRLFSEGAMTFNAPVTP